MSHQGLVICEYCDAVHQRHDLPWGSVALCQRCSGVLYRSHRNELTRMLALVTASLFAFVFANLFPIVTIELQGARNEATLWGAILATYDSGVGLIAALAALTVFFFPLLQIVLYGYVLVPLCYGQRALRFRWAMHALRHVAPWSMVEVFLLGALVSVVKLAGLAEIVAGPGLWFFLALTILLTKLSNVPLHDIWDLADEIAP
jgi:paraquat-inducible protein A